MPSPAEGLTFGDFTAEEWKKFFKRSADEFGNSPPVEFLFEFEYSDDEEPASYVGSAEHKVCVESFSAARNVTAGPEDSGVEVGHESEQEIPAAELTKQMGGTKSDDQSKTGDEVTELVQEPEMRQDVTDSTYCHKRDTQQIVFAGGCVSEETGQAKKGNSPSGPSSPESDSFPQLSSAVTGHTDKPVDKPENERSRKRRKRRRQRKRSGSVSSSSSEGSEKERGSVSAGSTKNKGVSNVLSAEKEALQKEKEWNDTEHDPADEKTSQQGKDTSPGGDRAVQPKTSSSTGDTSNSPTQSDTDLKSTESVQPDIASCQDRVNLELASAEQQSAIKPDEEVGAKKDSLKPLSWADLFKNAPKSSGGIVIKGESSVGRVETRSSAAPKKADEPVQTTVGVHEDKHSKRLAEIIQKVELDYHQKPYIPRGLTNRGNWCYVNAILQALVGCSPFFNLLKELPLIDERGPTSTPILDSLIHFMSEFKSLPAKPAASARMLSKAGFNIGEPWEPTHVYKMLSLIESSLSLKGRQEDAQEFLSCMLNGMHEEMLQLDKIVSSPGKVQEQSTNFKVLAESEDIAVIGENSPTEEDDDGDWEQVGPRNKSMVTRMASYPQSLISNIFGGYLRSSVYQTGLKDSANVEPFFELHLDVQTVASIEEALKNLVLKEEVQGYTCTKTKTQVDVSRRVTLEELPKVLILHLKRFIYSKSGSQKLQKVIDYPLDLTIGKELLSPNVRNKYPVAQKTYKLFAVVYHHGKNAWGGHYTTDVHHPVYGWVRADDTKLKVVPTNYVLKPTQGKDPYVLFYRRTDLMPF